MKLDRLTKRVLALESDMAAIEDRERREILSRLTYEELCQLETVCIRTQEWALPTTVEEQQFLDILRAKYGIS